MVHLETTKEAEVSIFRSSIAIIKKVCLEDKLELSQKVVHKDQEMLRTIANKELHHTTFNQ